jgi:DNA-directed RNA polymerase subunit H (RpoH/RPB5)
MSKSARVTQNSSSVINTIYNARNNLLTQLESRGFTIDEHVGCSVSEINSMHQNEQLDMLMMSEVSSERPIATKIYVKFFLGKKLAASNVQEIVDDLFVFEDQVLKKEDSLLVVSKDEPNEALINYQKHTWERLGIFVTIICIQRLQFNILNHEYVPPHRVMSSEEMVNAKKKFNVMNNDQFPEISRFDPVAMAVGLRPGQLCEIMRPSKTAVWSRYYRICV